MTQVDLHTLTVSCLSQQCAQESDRFFNRQEHDPRYCYELFQRAILQHNQAAWDAIFAQYQRLVCHWVERHGAFASSGEEARFFMNRAFEKMWLGITPEKIEAFPDLKSLLRYLQMCVHSVMVDYVRQKEYKLVLDSIEDLDTVLPAAETAVEEQVTTEIDREAFWTWLQQQFNHESERCVVQGMFVLALKPQEVQALYPAVFKDVNDVYRAKENLLARLRRNEEFRQFRDDA